MFCPFPLFSLSSSPLFLPLHFSLSLSLGGFSQNWAVMNKKASMFTVATNQWTTLPDMPLPSGGTGITHCGNAIWAEGRKIILAGGLGLGFIPASTTWPRALSRDEVYTFDVDSLTWARLPDLPASRGGSGAAVVGSTLYVFGGGSYGYSGGHWTFTADHVDTWSLDLNSPSDGWVTRRSMSVARNHLGAAVLAGIVYAIGGQNLEMEGCTNKNVVEAYNPASNTWSVVTSLPIALGHIGPSVLYPQLGFQYGIIIMSGVTNSGFGSCSPPGEAC